MDKFELLKLDEVPEETKKIIIEHIEIVRDCDKDKYRLIYFAGAKRYYKSIIVYIYDSGIITILKHYYEQGEIEKLYLTPRQIEIAYELLKKEGKIK